MKKIGKREIIIIVSIILVLILISVTGYAVWSDNKRIATSSTAITNDIQVIDVQNILDTNTIIEESQIDTDEPLKELTEEEMKKEEVNVEEELKNENTAKYYIKVNYKANTITIYGKDENNKYTVPIKAMVCSTGKATPRSGVYKTSSKYRWHTLNGGVAGQYCTRIVGHILFHSVPYAEKYNPASLKYASYDKLGTAASSGCIRVTVADAIWLYNNCESGTMVEFYASSNPGPLGKPSARKIAKESSSVRGWDPTDPDPNNPWENYDEIKAKEEKAKQEALQKQQEEERKRQEELEKQKAEEEAKRLEEEKKKQEEEEKAKQEQEKENETQETEKPEEDDGNQEESKDEDKKEENENTNQDEVENTQTPEESEKEEII